LVLNYTRKFIVKRKIRMAHDLGQAHLQSARGGENIPHWNVKGFSGNLLRYSAPIKRLLAWA
jgi:hypothetical protein